MYLDDLLKKTNDLVPGIESIKTQIDDPVVDELTKQFELLQESVIRMDDKDSMSAMKRTSVKNIFKEVDNILHKRFGIPFKHVGSDFGYGIYTVSTGLNNAIDPMREDVYKWLKQYTDSCKKSKDCTSKLKNIDDIFDVYEDEATIMVNLSEATKKIKQAVNVGKIVIDYDKATVKNFPKDATVVIVSDFVTYFKNINVTPREFTAFLLHEIGHQFEILGNDYRRLADVTVLVKTFTDTLRKKDAREALRLTLRNTQGNEIYEEGDTVSMFTALTSRLIHIMNEDNNYFKSDNEQLADQFASRFGVGKDIISGLHKINTFYADRQPGLSFALTTSFVIFVVYFFLILIMTFMPLIALTVSSVIAVFTFISTAITLTTQENDHEQMTYDIFMQRAKRLKFDLIRQLRESNIDRKTKREMISNIEYLEEIIELYIGDRKTMALLSNIMPWNIDSFTYTRLMKELEEASENDLHKHHEKFTLLGA